MEWLSDPKNVVLLATLTSAAASLAATFLPDGHWAMRVVNALAMNVGRAANDPTKQ